MVPSGRPSVGVNGTIRDVGTTVWALFRSDSKYFVPSQAAFMINYPVQDLDRMLSQLRKLGVGVESKVAGIRALLRAAS